MKNILIFLTLSILTVSVVNAEQVEEQYLAFAKSYGYVRYFYPGDEAASTDWDKFVESGIISINYNNQKMELEEHLTKLFREVAPNVVFYDNNSALKLPPYSEKALHQKPIFWQHLGKGGANSNIYKSKRAGRILKSNASFGNFGNVINQVDLNNVGATDFRLSAWIKTEKQNLARLWARVDLSSGQRGFFDNMSDRPFTSEIWKRVIIEGKVDTEATRLVFGVNVSGNNTAWIDNFEIEVKLKDNKWKALAINNSGFELWDGSSPSNWMTPNNSYSLNKAVEGVYDGNFSASIGPIYSILNEDNDLFESQIKSSDFVNRPISSNLNIYMPLIVLGGMNKTFLNSSLGGDKLDDNMGGVKFKSTTQSKQLADLIVLWNEIQHFYPYREQLKDVWENELYRTISKILKGIDDSQFDTIIEKLLLNLNDGHARLIKNIGGQLKALPIQFDEYDGKIVVLESFIDDVIPGDIISKIEGEDAFDKYKEISSLVSGSKQWKRNKALNDMRFSSDKDNLMISINKNGIETTKKLRYEHKYLRNINSKHQIMDIERDILYVDLSRVSMKDIETEIQRLISAKSIIFDLRGRPNNNHLLLSYLLNSNEYSKDWMKVPQIEFPNFENVKWKTMGWDIPLKKPNITSNIVFISSSNAISYTESFLGFIKAYHLGTIIGDSTAGANGNINYIDLPSGKKIIYTGMKVVNHDGSNFHSIGIEPDIKVVQSMDSIINRKDIYIETAIKYLRGDEK